MFIKDMFAKPIDRDIKGVIKVGQADDENIKQELEEYVSPESCKSTLLISSPVTKKGSTDTLTKWVSGSPASSEAVNPTS